MLGTSTTVPFPNSFEPFSLTPYIRPTLEPSHLQHGLHLQVFLVLFLTKLGVIKLSYL